MADKPRISSNFGGQAFNEQLEFFRQKVNLPTEKWDDLKRGMHARAFVIAGATRDNLLTDIRTSVEKLMENGGGIKEFRADFDNIVQKHGWEYNGGAGWRSKVIFETNMRTAYMAGRYKQMTDPDVLKMRPYWQYRHGDSRVPRPEHLAWHGKVLRADDPWWETHYPPNGWGCKCTVVSLSDRDLARDGLTVSESPTEPESTSGIDENWDYNVGESAWGRPMADTAMDSAPLANKEEWESITPGNPQSYNLPDLLPLEEPLVEKAPHVETKSQMMETIKEILGGEEKTINFKTAEFDYPVYVNASSLANHTPLNRGPFLPFLQETIENPTEAWMSFEKSTLTGKIALRLRFLKAHAIKGGKGKGIVVVANAVRGLLQGWTLIPASDLHYLQKQRHGKLLKSFG